MRATSKNRKCKNTFIICFIYLFIYFLCEVQERSKFHFAPIFFPKVIYIVLTTRNQEFSIKFDCCTQFIPTINLCYSPLSHILWWLNIISVLLCFVPPCLKMPKAATGGVLYEGVFLKILQNLQKNTSATVSFLIKLQTRLQLYLKLETLAQVFSRDFCEISKNSFFTEHLLATTSEML